MAVYRIDQFLGEGGFAYVYRARDSNLDIDVALKVLKPAFAYDEVFEENFRREAHRAAKFRHPNVIAIHYAGKDDDIVFFSMDLLETGLKDLMRPGKPTDEGAIIKVGMDVASALQFAHTHEGGIVHRDLKPDNILFDRHGNAVVTDFGIAEAATNYTAATGTTVYVGTPKYMSPEQARGQRVDHRSDIYSLGVTLYEMATGAAPFTGRDWFELGRKHIEELPTLPRELNTELDPELERVLLKCLQKNPQDRYQSAEQLRTELQMLDGGTQRTVVLTVQPAEAPSPTPAPTPATPAPSVQAAHMEEARDVQRGPADLYTATTRPPQRKGGKLGLLVVVAMLAGVVGAYSLDVAGLRTLGEEKLPSLSRIPFLGTGSVYATSFYFASIEGGADINAPRFEIRFSGPIDPSTANSEHVKLMGPNGRQIQAEITVSDEARRIDLVPAVRLAYQADYTIVIGTGFMSADGIPILQNPRARQPGARFTFRTRLPPPDTEQPNLSSSTPATDSRNVSVNQAITLVFSEAMDPTSVTSESVRLRDGQGSLVDIQIFVSEDQRTARVQPTNSLGSGVRYALLLSPAITDASGNALPADSIIFSTRGGQPVVNTPAEPATLSVKVQPADAVPYMRIVLDGERIGSPPRLNMSISSGVSHTIQLLAGPAYSGHMLVVHEENWLPRAGQSREIAPQIQPFGWITVASEPPADVFIDGKFVGSSPVAGYVLFSGTHRLELHPAAADSDRYAMYSLEFEVPAFGERNLGSLKLPAAQ